MTYYGLVDDVLRSAKQESVSSGSSRRRKRSRISSGSLPKSLSLNNVLSNALKDTAFRSAESSISLAHIEEVKGHPESRSNRARFLGLVKRYLSFKSIAKDSLIGKSQHFEQARPPVGGVFRPGSAHGATIILLAENGHVTVFGHKNDLALLFPYDDVISLRMTSSAFINCQTTLNTTQWESWKTKEKNQSTADFLTSLYNHRLKKFGFVLTVQLQWKDGKNKDLHHQWLLHRKCQTRLNSMGRKSTVIQRLFYKSSFNLNSTNI